MEYGVSIQIGGEDVLAGTLFARVRRGVESATFLYDAVYLADRRSFPLAPDLPLSDGAIHTQCVTKGRGFCHTCSLPGARCANRL